MEAKEDSRKSLRDLVNDSMLSILSTEVVKTKAFQRCYRGDGTSLSIVAFGYQAGLFGTGLSQEFQTLLKQAYTPVYESPRVPEDAYQLA